MHIEPKELQAMLQSAKQILRSKRCIYAGYGPCDEPIIAAHTVSKCLGLKEMAMDGFVYASDLKPHPTEPGTRGYVKTGIKQVSTFNFSCQKHDNDLFSSIESGSLEINDATVQLFFLRSMAQEIYEGKNQQEFIKLLPIMQTEQMITGVSAKESDNLYYFERAKSGGLTLKYCCLSYAHPLPFLTSTAHSPFLSIGGKLLFESTNIDEVAPVIVINVFNHEGKGKILFSWPEECSSTCEKFMRELLLLSPTTDIILSFLFVETQNLILDVAFYEYIPKEIIDDLLAVQRFNRDSLHAEIKPIPLYNFGLPNLPSFSSNVPTFNSLNVGSVSLQ
jgi:hypothetical protein